MSGTGEQLKPYHFKSGKDWDGNAAGRPTGPTLTSLVRKNLNAPAVEFEAEIRSVTFAWFKAKPKETLMAALARAVAVGAFRNPKVLSQMWDRLEGKVPQQMTLDVSEKFDRLMRALHDEPPTIDGVVKLLDERSDDGADDNAG